MITDNNVNITNNDYYLWQYACREKTTKFLVSGPKYKTNPKIRDQVSPDLIGSQNLCTEGDHVISATRAK